MRVRILYATATQAHGIKGAGGDVATVDDDLAKSLIAAGAVEEVEEKVERATKAPGEKRNVRRPRKPKEE